MRLSPIPTGLRASIASARREGRQEAIERVLSIIESAQSVAEFALMDCDGIGDGNAIADVLVNLQNAKDLVEGMR